MSEKKPADSTGLFYLEERMRGVEIQMSQLVQTVHNLAETSAISQVQMAEQSKIQTDLLITMQKDRSENAALADHVTGLVEDVSDLRTWVNKQKGGIDVKNGIRAMIAVTLSGIIVAAFAFWISFKYGGP